MEKKCVRCKKTKEVGDFYKSKYSKDGFFHYCKECDNTRKTNLLRKKSLNKAIFNKKKARYWTLLSRENLSNGLKYCPCCEKVLDILDFYKNKASRDGLDSHCIECKKIMSRLQTEKSKHKTHLRYLKRKEEQKNKKLQKKYGISLNKYNEMLVSQNYKCEICEATVEENGKLLAVDHSHVTNKVRGLLCNNCNVAIGFIKDDKEKAIKLAKYIEKYNE